jgi:glycosyltransferase involved in cell wall biosynthesis
MIRVLSFMHTSSPIGGVETWLDRACAHLAARGFEPIVGLVRGQKFNRPERYRSYHPALNAIEIDGRGLNREGRVRALMRGIRRVRPALVLPLGIVDAYEATIRCKRRGDELRLLARAQGNLAPMLADLALYRDWIDLVVCPGRLTRRVLVRWAGFDSERVLNLANGADPPFAARVPRAIDQPLRLGYVGRLSRLDKRCLDLVPLCRELDARAVRYELDIVGDGPCDAELRAALAGRDAVRFHGALPHHETYARIFPKLDMLVLTSSSESFGIVLVEAMMHGVVPVSSRYDGFQAQRLVVDGETGLSFAVGDLAAAGDAIARLASDRARLEALAERARAAGARYTWSRSLEGWESVLRHLAVQPPRRGRVVPVLPDVGPRGRLERIGVPDAVVDLARRVRRALVGPAVAPGGEEWPLFQRSHSPATLASVAEALRQLDTPEPWPDELEPDATSLAAASPVRATAVGA